MAARRTVNGTPLDEATYVIVDLETTGLDHRAEKIIEIGAVKMVGSRAVATFERLVNPNRLIPPKIVKLTGITNTMTANAPVIDEALPGFARFAGDAVLVAHNAHFDMSFLKTAAREIGMKAPRNRYFDTKLIAQRLKPAIGFYRLANLARYFNVTHQPNHRALSDALATAEVFAKLLESMEAYGINTVEEASRFFYPKTRHDFGDKKQLAQNLPDSSGVYLMKDKYSRVIYVGKAVDLNKRVRSYFYSGPRTERQLSLLSEIHTIDHIKTGTEIGALLLESKLIKSFKPAYNVLGKGYRHRPFVHIDFDDLFPTPKLVRRVEGRGFHYGPFSNASDVELLLEVAKDLYRLKQCDHVVRPGNLKEPCFYFQVKRCCGPCGGKISTTEYRKRLAAVAEAFDGRPEKLRDELVRRRASASEKLYFERASLLNRSLQSLESTAKILEGIRNTKANFAFLLAESLQEKTRVYLVAAGQLRSCVDIKHDVKSLAKLERKIARIYFAGSNRTSRIDLEKIENLSLLTSYFNKRNIVKVNIGISPAATVDVLLAAVSPLRS
jgi:DNA polymerase-3 subunit epsilon